MFWSDFIHQSISCFVQSLQQFYFSPTRYWWISSSCRAAFCTWLNVEVFWVSSRFNVTYRCVIRTLASTLLIGEVTTVEKCKAQTDG